MTMSNFQLKLSLSVLFLCLVNLTACSNKLIMKISTENQALSELDFYRAKSDCSSPYRLAGWTTAGPVAFTAFASATESSREHEGQNAFMACMNQRGYACSEYCTEGLGSNAALDQRKMIGSKQSVISTTPAVIESKDLTVGRSVLPGSESMVLYKYPARDAERVERLSESTVMTVKAISGEWVNVVTATGSFGWVNGLLVRKQ